MEPSAEPIVISVDRDQQVSGLWLSPAKPSACFVLAHGAGAGMRHRFLEGLSTELNACGIATLRYQFPYMDKGSRRPDPPKICHDTVRAAVRAAATLTKSPLFAGGRSFGGRMTSQAIASGPMPALHGLIFLAFPLHPAGKPSINRAQHLGDVSQRMLFVQGTRDELAELTRLKTVVRNLGSAATLELFEDADHSFHVRKSSGTTDADVLQAIVRVVAQWVAQLI